MTKEAQNCLLKTLEEPPNFVVIILITSNENLILNTIKSRCTKLNFSKLSKEQITNILNENISVNLLNASEGSIRKTTSTQKK